MADTISIDITRMRMLPSFFFQAEDGIRDWSVTGVQTCALPIWPRDGEHHAVVRLQPVAPVDERALVRSEERRVGKECRCRWTSYPHIIEYRTRIISTCSTSRGERCYSHNAPSLSSTVLICKCQY